MIQLLGAALLVAGCGGLGMAAVSRLDGRVRDLRELSAGLEILQREDGGWPRCQRRWRRRPEARRAVPPAFSSSVPGVPEIWMGHRSSTCGRRVLHSAPCA